MPTGRAFVAVVPPPEVLDAVAPVAACIGAHLADARLVARAQWHLTLQFLGDRVDLDATAEALESLRADPFGVRLAGVGAFADPWRARVVWIGVDHGAAELRVLAAAVARSLAPTGFAAEDRDHHPHLTIARLRAPTDVRVALAVGADEARAIGAVFGVREVVLFESVVRREGAEHRPLMRVSLRGA